MPKDSSFLAVDRRFAIAIDRLASDAKLKWHYRWHKNGIARSNQGTRLHPQVSPKRPSLSTLPISAVWDELILIAQQCRQLVRELLCHGQFTVNEGFWVEPIVTFVVSDEVP
jgi:hypothetical protein